MLVKNTAKHQERFKHKREKERKKERKKWMNKFNVPYQLFTNNKCNTE